MDQIRNITRRHLLKFENQTTIVNHHITHIAMDANKTGATIQYHHFLQKPNESKHRRSHKRHLAIELTNIKRLNLRESDRSSQSPCFK